MSELQRRALASLIILLGLTMTLWAECGMVEGSSFDSRDVTRRGTVEVGAATGFWQGTTVVGHAQSSNRSAVFVLPRVGVVLTDQIGTGWWKGNVEVIVEPLFARFTKPFVAEAVGGSFVMKYNFLSFGRWMPFWDVGAGMIWTNLAPRIPEQSTPFEFVLETGPGVHYFLSDRLAWTMGVRAHHISNGNIGDRNTGMNAVLPYIGLSVFVPNIF